MAEPSRDAATSPRTGLPYSDLPTSARARHRWVRNSKAAAAEHAPTHRLCPVLGLVNANEGLYDKYTRDHDQALFAALVVDHRDRAKQRPTTAKQRRNLKGKRYR